MTVAPRCNTFVHQPRPNTRAALTFDAERNVVCTVRWIKCGYAHLPSVVLRKDAALRIYSGRRKIYQVSIPAQGEHTLYLEHLLLTSRTRCLRIVLAAGGRDVGGKLEIRVRFEGDAS